MAGRNWGRHIATPRPDAVRTAGDPDAQAVVLAVGGPCRREAEQILAVQLLGDAGGRGRETSRVTHHLGAAAAVVGDLAQRVRVHARVDWLRRGRIDRNRVHEGIAAEQRRAHFLQGGVARGIGAIRDDHQGPTLPAALLELRQGGEHGVVDGGAAGRLQTFQARPHQLRVARPPGEQTRRMVEGEHEVLVGGIEQLEEEPLHRRTRVHETLAEHAVAHVQRQAERDRHSLVRELRDRPRLAILVELEGIARQPAHEPSVVVVHGGGHRDDLDTRAIRLVDLDGRLHPAGGGQRKTRYGHRETHAAILPRRHPARSEMGRRDNCSSPCSLGARSTRGSCR